MTEGKSFKRRVRTRMEKTGESYTSARKQVSERKAKEQAARDRLSDPMDRPSDDAVREATGNTWDEWFEVLDRWGARDRTHTETAEHLTDDLDVAGWWAQSVTVAYQRARGMRLKHQQADGFSISASKTVNAPLETLYEAVMDLDRRSDWLPDGDLKLRTTQPRRSARFDWDDGTERVNFGFTDKGPDRSVVSLSHERISSAQGAETAKIEWRSRLSALKALLEA